MNMKFIHRAYRNFTIAVQIGVFVIIFLAIYPVAVKDVCIESIGKATWSFDGENVIIEVPVKIKNGGYYDINAIKMAFGVKNSTSMFIDSNEELGNIKGGEVKTLKVHIPINLRRIYNLEMPSLYHFYNYDTFHVNFSLSLKYLWNMVLFKSNYRANETWEPILKELKTYHPNMLFENNSKIKIILPYKISTAHYLYGNAKFDGDIYGNGKIGEFNTDFPLGKEYKGNLNLIFNLSSGKSLIIKSQNLHLRGNLSFMGFNIPLAKDYWWGAPLNNFKVEVLDNGTLHYSFSNDADFGMNLHITKTYYYNGTIVKNETETINVNPGDSVNKYEKIDVNQPVDKVVITIHDDNTGLNYQEEVNL